VVGLRFFTARILLDERAWEREKFKESLLRAKKG
jgi:hypothetical protein